MGFYLERVSQEKEMSNLLESAYVASHGVSRRNLFVREFGVADGVGYVTMWDNSAVVAVGWRGGWV